MPKRVRVSVSRIAMFAGMVAVCLAATAAWAQKSAEKASEDRLAFRKSILTVRGQIDTTLAALKGIVDAKDDGARQGAVKKYGDQLKEMDKQIQKTKDYAKQMKERGQAYFAEWEKSMQTISNESLKAKAAERRATLQAQYQQIQAGVDQARQDSTKFWKDLQDLQKYFGNDASAGAVAASTDMIASASTDGKKIQGYIDQVVAAVDNVGKQVEPAAPAASAAPAMQAQPAGESAPAEEAEPEGDKPPQEEAESEGE